MKVLLLPGMDGTGQLFEPLLRAWPGDLAPTVVSLNHLSADGYREQVAQLCGQLSAAPVVIVAESYSGPIAYALCRELGSRVAGVVFLASFVSRPCGVVRLARRLPAASLRLDWLPDRLLNGIGFGGLGTAASMASVRLAVQDVAPAVLKQRLSNMAVLREPSERISTPAVYIRPTRDYLVSQAAVDMVARVFPALRVIPLEGGHFIAQGQPDACAQIILQFVRQGFPSSDRAGH
ncbi:alpha/beta fold hydrolase [Marinobacter xestospongiae]|uniref:alpha/beta fold hydrolase n=1 Tax=Marinobacter xestospongiae TaxID=994319 RepID=UPI002005005F|nr:alpha/beta hydrolase [Marinobacter xestospongiae]MCK7568055.1 alpha/beta hydrolase [Marinobacter xestospongiae]